MMFLPGTASGRTIGLNLKRPLYLGGVDPQEVLPASAFVGEVPGFVGCIGEVCFIICQKILREVTAGEGHCELLKRIQHGIVIYDGCPVGTQV